jgi:endonuclease G
LLLIAALVLWYLLVNGLPTGPPNPSAPPGNETEDQYVHLRWGNPSGATADAGNRDNFLMKKKDYALSYNNRKGTPNWVSWRVVQEDLGGASRAGLTFQPDDELPDGFKKVVTGEYVSCGFDRGHMCPAGDRTRDRDYLQATFVMTNVVPQSPANNRKGWEQFESYCRSLVKEGKELYVVAGPQGQGGVGEKGPAEVIAGGNVVVPAQTWKVALVLNRGDGVGPDSRLIAIVTPNDETVVEDWSRYRVSVRAVEQLTGYKFFDRADPTLLDPLKEKVDAARVPPPREHDR